MSCFLLSILGSISSNAIVIKTLRVASPALLNAWCDLTVAITPREHGDDYGSIGYGSTKYDEYEYDAMMHGI